MMVFVNVLRTFMMLAWSLTVVAFVLILVEVQGISSTISYNPHTIIGTTITYVQPPPPTSSHVQPFHTIPTPS
jgi:hypothetical protein